MAIGTSSAARRRDDAVRAAWLYFNAGRTQDEIARQMDISRQAAQRLVAQAVDERLVSFRIDHPIATCTALAAELVARYGLDFCDVVPSDKDAPDALNGIALAAAERINRLLASQSPIILGVGTGRTLRATVDYLEEYERPQHKILSLVGNMAIDGHASPYEVAMRIADKANAQRYPLPAPVLAESAKEKAVLQRQRSYRLAIELKEKAHAIFVGIGPIAWQSPLHQDGFATDEDISELLHAGAIGEIIGRSFDANGHVLDTPANQRVSSLELSSPPKSLTVMVGCGPHKVSAIQAGLAGKLATALVTDESTASALMASAPS